MTPTWESDDGTVRLFLGDCLDALPHVKADCVVTDPPYGVDFRGKDWDASIPDWLGAAREAAPVVVFTSAIRTMWNYPKPDWVLCWYREASNGRSDLGGFNHWSPVMVYGKPRFKVDSLKLHAIQHAYPKGFPHPSPKPLALMEWLVAGTTQEGQTVLDPFMGSGTTIEAAIRLGRKAIGIELDPHYFWDLCVPRAKRALAERAAQLPFEEKA